MTETTAMMTMTWRTMVEMVERAERAAAETSVPEAAPETRRKRTRRAARRAETLGRALFSDAVETRTAAMLARAAERRDLFDGGAPRERRAGVHVPVLGLREDGAWLVTGGPVAHPSAVQSRRAATAAERAARLVGAALARARRACARAIPMVAETRSGSKVERAAAVARVRAEREARLPEYERDALRMVEIAVRALGSRIDGETYLRSSGVGIGVSFDGEVSPERPVRTPSFEADAERRARMDAEWRAECERVRNV